MGIEEDWLKDQAEKKRLAEIDRNFDILVQKLDVSVAFEKKYFGKEQKEEPVDKILPDATTVLEFIEDVRLWNMYYATPDTETKFITFNSKWKKMQVSMDGVIELLSDKFKLPVPKTEGVIKTKPPFIEGMDKIINEKMSWAQAEFNKILALGDPKIKKICYDFYRMQSYPLLVRIKYMEWEKTVESWKIEKIMVKLNDDLSLKIREIHKDYKDKLTNEKKTLVIQIEKLQKEVLGLRNLSETMNALHQNGLTDIAGLKQEIETLVNKNKTNDELLMKYQAENIEYRTLLKEATDKVEKYEAIGWAADFTSTEEHPVFCNATDGDIKKFPCSMSTFRTNYVVKSSDGEQRTYSSEGKEDFTIPESLALKLPTLLAPPKSATEKQEEKQENGKEKPEEKLLKNIRKILKALQESDVPLTKHEISQKTGIKDLSNLKRRYLDKMVSDDMILFDEVNETYSLNPDAEDD